MKNPLLKTMRKNLLDFLPIFLGFFSVFLVSRCFEWGLIIYNHGNQLIESSYIAPAILYDFSSSLVCSIPVWLLFKGLKNINQKLATNVVTTLITLLGLCNILLITYFSATLVPLGPEFWAYSISEMSETVIASNQLTVWRIILLIIYASLLYLGIYRLIQIKIANLPDFAYPSLVLGTLVVPSLIGALVISDNTPYSYPVNKLNYFINQSVQNSDLFVSSSPSFAPVKKEYPFLHQANQKDVLGDYLKKTNSPPNIVFLMVESLGGEFVGNSGQWTGFTPFINSLAQKGLYWQNGLSLSGRTFGLVPSLLGSLPPVQNGFMDLAPSYPNHQSLISLLNNAGYHTSFFSGYDTYFDGLEYFLKYQSTDFTLSKQLIEEKHLSHKGGQNYWGIDDQTMFDIASGILDTLSTAPRLEIYHTLQNHSPFVVPKSERYKQKFDQRLQNLNLPKPQKELYQRYESELTTLLFTDDAIRHFMEDYQQRQEYQRTIFVITGDHWLIPIPQTTEISRYHVPIIIYSPLLKKGDQFKSVNTHANIVPSLAAYLDQFSSITMPDSVHWIGSGLDTAHAFQNTHSLPLMKNKNQLTDYLHNEYYLADNQLFMLNENMTLRKVENKLIHRQLKDKISHFKAKSRYAIAKNKLHPGNSQHFQSSGEYDFIVRYDSVFQKMDEQNLTIDQQFEQARQYAFDGQYKVARAISRRILLQYPNYHDVRILMGRTHAWEENYEQARTIFKNIIERDPSYYDTYNALFDTEFWAGNYETALHVIDDGLKHHPIKKQFLEKKIRILTRLSRQPEARHIFIKYRTQYPESTLLPQLKQLF